MKIALTIAGIKKTWLLCFNLLVIVQVLPGQDADLAILPEPKEISFKTSVFTVPRQINIVAGNAAEDKFAAADLAEFIKQQFGVDASLQSKPGEQLLLS